MRKRSSLQRILPAIIKKLTSETQPAETVQPVSSFNYNANLQYHKAPDAYRKDATQQGTV